MPFNVLVAVCLAYVFLLFLVAFVAERRAQRGRLRFLHRPIVYTLSLSIYCTAWTFYGAVGYAARSGLEFVTIYLGPTLVFVGWWWILRKLVRIGRAQRVTSIADLISSRYGKSNLLGVIVTLMSVATSAPYIALQLQSVTLSFGVFAADTPEGWALPDQGSTALWIAAGLTLFTILFGTRNLDANERHHGVVMAIALEAVVKLVALLAVGVFVVWGIAHGPLDVLARTDASPIADWDLKPGRFAGLIFVSAAAILTLPRMFQVLVVENVDERHLATASWAFPGYLMLMSLFVMPIAVIGLEVMPAGSNPDLFVLTLPLSQGQGNLALLAFLGGFSSATSMVIVAAIALATMVSNHIVTPLWLALGSQRGKEMGDIRGLVLMSRRLSIAVVLGMGYGYYSMSGGSAALASIGLIAFVGAAQVLPALLGGMFWRGATRMGAVAALLTGFAMWLYTLFLPSFGESGLISAQVMAAGPFDIGWLRPQALFGIDALDPLLHALFWSLLFNTISFMVFSTASFPGPMERLQGVAFVNIFEQTPGARSWLRGQAEAEDLLSMAQRILGAEEAQRFFQAQAAGQGKEGFLPDPTPDFLARLERQLAGSVGAATAHAMISQLTGGSSVSVQDLIAVAGEAAEIKEYSAQLEAKSEELARTARALRDANEKLTSLSVQKDAFLGQISHELRTPMTSIRAFSEILMEPDLPDAMRSQYAEIIHEEARRLTRLLDDLLDLSVLENRKVQLNVGVANLHDLLNRAVQSASNTRPERSFRVERDFPSEHMPVFTDTDRLVQVFINLISNSRKYCDNERAVLRIEVKKRGQKVQIDFIDNGSGIPKASQALIFEKFSRLTDTSRAGGAGLGLAICREIMANLGGKIDYVPGQGGAAFRVTLPLRRREMEEAAKASA
ncbi:ATP-binding protein [Sedimentimonas flavescens]|uniref:ATP-binding protein n=1 Tax=Sedimentimonas flavescens TaxID=2851012 RepID=UPI001C49E305|nr:ATP-binding protein [Sedimentimonas flavescens]MBW0159121.1 sodium:solute symporter [Sedimentimonas flavescens]MCT2540101.1 ATP-binding protein [Sedimentimonas flavescens]